MGVGFMGNRIVESGPENRHPMAVAMQWVGRIMAAAAIMVLPGLMAQWLGRKISADWITLVGFCIGLATGIYYLIAVTRPPTKNTE